MARLLRILTVLLLLLLPLIVLVSQKDSATAGDSGSANPDQQVGFLTLTPTPIPFPTSTIDPENTPEPTPFPSQAPELTVEARLILDARHDMDVMADDRFGAGTRPIGWNLNVNQYDPQLTGLARGDLELLATALINPSSRPDGWIGAYPGTPYAVARDVRYDLELLANLFYGKNQRPAGWIGGDPLLRCNRATQDLVALLERGGVYNLSIAPNVPDFCREAELDVTKFVEAQILANAQVGNLFSDQVALLAKHQIVSTVAVAFLDTAATKRVGVIPKDTPIQIIGRSYAQFSKMMLVSGADFQVFVDYTNTTVTDQQFRALPNVDSLQTSPGCFADWCGGGG